MNDAQDNTIVWKGPGWVSMRYQLPPVYGRQLPSMIYERFDGTGHLVETRLLPPAARIIYPTATEG